MIYAISYDLIDQKDYEKIRKAIEEKPPTKDDEHSAHKALLSLWLVDSSSTAKTWSDHLRTVTDTDDLVLVARLRSNGETAGHCRAGTAAWLSSTDRRW